MMYFLRVLVTALSFYLMAEPAHAGFIAAAISLIGSLGSAGGFAAALGKLLVGLIANVAMSLLQKALMKDPEPVGVVIDVRMGDDQPFGIVVGNYATAGLRKYIGTWGSAGKTPNAYLVDVIEIGNIPNRAGAQAVSSIWINDKKVKVLWDEPHTDGRGYPVEEFREEDTDYLWVKFYDGTQDEVDPYLLDKFGTHPDRPWKNDMIGRGVQYMIVTTRYTSTYFNGVPASLPVPKPVPMYDLRKDSTNGGSGTHRWNDPTTWEPTTNPIIIIYNIIRGIYYGTEWLFGGQNLAAFRLPASNWIAAANECDVLITAKIYDKDGVDTGETKQVKQFMAGYDIRGDMDPLKVIDDMRQACNARIAETGGIFKVLVGAPGAAVYTFTDDDIIVSKGQSYNPFPSLEEIYNGVEATYPEPKEKWAAKDAPARYSSEYEEADGNRRLVTGVQFLAAPYADQVQRLMRAMIEEERRFRIHSFYLPPDAYALEPNDVVSYSSERNGYINKKFLVIRIEGEPTFNQLVILREIDPSDYDWSSSFELPVIEGWTGVIEVDPQPMDGWNVVADSIADGTGNPRRPAIVVSCLGNNDDVEKVQIQVRVKATQQVVFDSDQIIYQPPYAWRLSGEWLLPTTEYEARGRFVPGTARRTLFSGWISVTTPDLRIASVDVFDNAIIAAKLADNAVISSKIATDAVTSLKIAADAVTETKLAVDAVTRRVIKNGEIIAAKIADAALEISKFPQDVRPIEIVSSLPTTGNFEGRQVMYSGKVYRYTSGAWTASVATVDLTGQVLGSQIADLAISATKLADGSVLSNKIADNAVNIAKFATGLRPVEIVSSLPTTGNVEGRQAFFNGKLYRYTSGAWTASVDGLDLAAGSVTSTQIADNAITTPKLVTNAISSDKIAANAITVDKIAANAITAGKIQAGAVGADKIAANAITAQKMAIGDFDNLVQNATFVNNMAGWFSYGGSGGGSVVPYSGTEGAGIRFTKGTGTEEIGVHLTGYNSTGDAFSGARVRGGETIRLKAKVKRIAGTAASGNIGFWGSFLTNTNTIVSASLGAVVSSVAVGATAEISAVYTIPSNYVGVAFQIYYGSNASSDNGDVVITDISVMRMNTAELYVDGSITALAIAANAITADKVAANTISARELVLSDFSNILPDNGIQSVSSWTISGFALAVVEQNATFGNTFRWTTQGTATTDYIGGVVSSRFSVTPGDELYFGGTVDMDTDTSQQQVRIYIRVYAADGSTQLDNALAQAPDNYTANLTANSIVIPANAVTADFYIRRGTKTVGATSTGSVRVWNLFVFRKANANLIVDGSITANAIATNAITSDKITANAITSAKIAAGAISADKIQANSITAKQLIIADFSNLILDNTFTDPANWSITSGVFSFVTLSADYGAAGGRGVRSNFSGITAPAGATVVGGCYTVDYLPVESDKEYTWGGNINPSAGATGKVQLRVYFYDSTGVSLTVQGVEMDVSTTTSERGFSMTYKAPATASSARFQIRRLATTAGGNVGTGYVYIYNVFLRRSSSSELIVDGAITADKIAANAVTATKILAGTITATQIATGAITSVKISADAITSDKIAANSIYGTHLVANSISARELILQDYSNTFPDYDGQAQTGFYTGIASGVAGFFTSGSGNRGKAGVRIYPTSDSSSRSVYTPWMQIETAADYRLEGSVAQETAGTAGTCGMYVQLGTMDSAGVVTYTRQVGITSTNSTPTTRTGVNFTTTGSERQFRLRYYIDGATDGPCLFSGPMVRRRQNADLIVDGSITADKILANTITADRIVVGGIDVTRLAANSVTVVASASSNVASSNFNGTEVQVASISVTYTTEADAVDITFSASYNVSTPSGPLTNTNSTLTLLLKRAGTTIATYEIVDSTVAWDSAAGANRRVATAPMMNFSYSDKGFTGSSATYTVTAQTTIGGGVSATATRRYIKAMATKR